MAKNEVSMFDPSQVPDHIREFNATTETNITGTVRANTLTYKGKVFTVTLEGNKQVLMKKNEDGEEEPRQSIPVVILGYAKRRGRSYYSGGFVDDKPTAPTCWSKDGITPDADVPEKQSAKCATCPMSAKGSKVTEDNRETKACAEHKFVAVQLYRRWDMPPLRVRLAITSLYDAKNKAQEEKGYYAFDQYCDMLRARGVKHTASVVTRIKFDPTTAYPKLLFNNAQWVTDAEELAQVTEIANSPEVQDLIYPVFDATADAGPALPKEDPEEDDPELTQAKPAKTAKPAPAAATTAKTGKPAPAPAKAPAKPKVKEPDPEPEAEEEALEGDVVDEGGEDATDVSEVVEATEQDEEEAAIAEAEAKAQALRDKVAARRKAEQDAAAKAAKARKAAPVDDEGETIVVATAKTGKPAPAPATAAKTNGLATAGKTTAGKVAAPKGTPAGKPAAVTKEVADIIDDW